MEITQRCGDCPKRQNPLGAGESTETDCPTRQPVKYMRGTNIVAVFEDGTTGQVFEEVPVCPEDLGPDALAVVIELQRQMDERPPEQFRPDGPQWV